MFTPNSSAAGAGWFDGLGASGPFGGSRCEEKEVGGRWGVGVRCRELRLEAIAAIRAASAANARATVLTSARLRVPLYLSAMCCIPFHHTAKPNETSLCRRQRMYQDGVDVAHGHAAGCLDAPALGEQCGH